jgi:hypothetical protein
MIRWLKFAALLGIGAAFGLLPAVTLAQMFFAFWVLALLSWPRDFEVGIDMIDFLKSRSVVLCMASVVLSVFCAFALALKALIGGDA